MTRKKKISRKILIIIAAFAVCIAAACVVYVNDYYHADEEAIAAFAVPEGIESYTDDEGNMVFEPAEADAGFIFYPGGKVEYSAYAPLMQQLASEGVLCVLVEMPFNLAVMDINAADGIPQQYPDIESWYIGGHSLGGSMAAAYLEENADDFDGLVLLGSYSTTDLTSTGLEVISVYGSEDGVLDMEKYNENKANLPDDYKEVVIDGGCHAYFGSYGPQEGDGKPSITGEEQIDITVNAITEVIN